MLSNGFLHCIFRTFTINFVFSALMWLLPIQWRYQDIEAQVARRTLIYSNVSLKINTMSPLWRIRFHFCPNVGYDVSTGRIPGVVTTHERCDKGIIQTSSVRVHIHSVNSTYQCTIPRNARQMISNFMFVSETRKMHSNKYRYLKHMVNMYSKIKVF